ncbi:hypothetical protein L7F22_059189 [Adiantum nelumboides]|nr:hypothetical protein [Adiantum nelumboides]
MIRGAGFLQGFFAKKEGEKAMVSMSMEAKGGAVGGGVGDSCGSFENVRSYITAVKQTPTRFRARAAAIVGPEEEVAHDMSHVENGHGTGMMERKVSWLEVVAMGVGGMMGAGILVSTGQAAHSSAGPAVILSFAIAGFSALLSALCYSEFVVSVPSAGGAYFSYLRSTLGEFAAYFTGANLLMEYVISNAMVARSFTSYLASVYGVSDSNAWHVEAHGLSPGYNMLDLPAVALIILLTVCISCSTKVSCRVNLVITVFHVALIGLMVVVGFANGSINNLRRPDGFAPFGAKGVWNGAALVYFSYIGFDDNGRGGAIAPWHLRLPPPRHLPLLPHGGFPRSPPPLHPDKHSCTIFNCIAREDGMEIGINSSWSGCLYRYSELLVSGHARPSTLFLCHCASSPDSFMVCSNPSMHQDTSQCLHFSWTMHIYSGSIYRDAPTT